MLIYSCLLYKNTDENLSTASVAGVITGSLLFVIILYAYLEIAMAFILAPKFRHHACFQSESSAAHESSIKLKYIAIQ